LNWFASHIWVAPLSVAIYLACSAGGVALLNLNLPKLLEQIVSILVAPGVLAILVFNPILKKFGLTTGDWATAPTFPALLIIVFAYALCAWLIAIAVVKLFAAK
jgi:hypothetical protein